MNKHWMILIAVVSLLCACHNSPDPAAVQSVGVETSNRAITSAEETETIGMPIEQHSVQLSHPTNKEQQTRELQSWWDSLPKPLQSQIKSKEVNIQLISNVRAVPEATQTVDAHVAETSKELERIIGTTADMSISTTITESETGTSDLMASNESTTSIQLLKKVPVKLSDYAAQIFLRKGEVTHENVQSMQYWWLSLPQDLQDKIKSQEIEVDITCYTIDKGDLDIKFPRHIATNAEDYAMMMADFLTEMVGAYQVGNKTVPLAKIATNARIEKSNNKNIQYPAAQYILIQLHHQREVISALPSL